MVGTLLQPYILKKSVNPKGEIEEEVEAIKIRRVISEKTSERIKDIMIGAS